MAKKIRKIRDQTMDKFYFPKETIETMKQLAHATHETGREHGMALCMSSDKKVVPGKSAIGEEDYINFDLICNSKKDKVIGSYHTHPRPSETKFSAQDLYMSCDKDSDVDCIGMNIRGEVECYAKKEKKSCQSSAEALVDIEDIYLKIDEEDRAVLKDVLLENVDRLTEQKFISKKIL